MRKEKISAVYQIRNIVTGERYVGSSKDAYKRWKEHKSPSTWKREPNKKLYKAFQEYGLESFMFAILAPVEPEYLKQVEQEFIGMLKPAYNSNRANGWDIERYKAYLQSEKSKAYQKAYQKVYQKAYANQLCNYNGETITLNTLSVRFLRAGIPHPVLEAKKYLVQPEHN